MDSPMDNTAVIRMKRDFDSFLSKSTKPSGRFNFDLDQSLDIADSPFRKSSIDRCSPSTVQSLMEKEAKVRAAELIMAKSKIAELEAEIVSLKTHRKRAKIEQERDYCSLQQEREADEQRRKEIKDQLKFLVEKEKAVKEELASCQHELSKTKTEYENKILNDRKEIAKLQEEKQQLKESSRVALGELKKDIIRYRSEAEILKSQLQETKQELDTNKRSTKESSQTSQELQNCKAALTAAEQKITELERQVSGMEEDSVIVNIMRKQIERVPLLEKENKRLREDNANLRDTKENILLLKEQNDSFRLKMDRFEAKAREFAQIKTENEELKQRLSEWEMAEQGSARNETPTKLTKRLADLQEQHVLLLEKQGELQSSIHQEREKSQSLQQQFDSLLQQYNIEKTKTQNNMDLLKRLQRKLLLVTKERDGFKGIIDSYESETTVNVAAITTNRLQQQEEVIEGYRKQIDFQEKELKRMTHELEKSMSGNDKSTHPPQQNGNTSLQEESASDQRIVLQLRQKIEKLEKQLEKVEEEKYILESRIEQRNLQGDYDPTKTKVLHFSMNPVAMAQQKRKEELNQLREENERLKERVKLLEESGGKMEDITMQVEKKMHEPSSSKEIDEMKAQLTREETKNKRLMEAFKKTSQELREVCYQLTGYRIDISSSKQYKVTSMYAESPEDYFLFQQSQAGEIQMLETDFSKTLKDNIELYLVKQDSIPGFLSSVTLELFSRQTMCL